MDIIRRKKIIDLYQQGWSYRRIGEKLNLSFVRVGQIINWIPPLVKLFNCAICDVKFSSYQKRRLCKECGITFTGASLLRELVRIRDQHTCQWCKKVWKKGTRRFDVHHLNEKFEGKSNNRGSYKVDKIQMPFMVTYCHKCHLNVSWANKNSPFGLSKYKVEWLKNSNVLSNDLVKKTNKT